MRLSPVIVFIAFALLASTSPIDDYSQRNNSLWRRDRSRQPEYHDPHSGTIIQNGILPNGKLGWSRVTFGPNRRPRNINGPIVFRTPEGMIGGPLADHVVAPFFVRGDPTVCVLVYYFKRRGEREMVLAFMMNSDKRWMIFHYNAGPPSENSGYIFTVDHLYNKGYVQHFYSGDKEVLLYLNARHANGGWQDIAILRYFEGVQWLDRPEQRPDRAV